MDREDASPMVYAIVLAIAVAALFWHPIALIVASVIFGAGIVAIGMILMGRWD